MGCGSSLPSAPLLLLLLLNRLPPDITGGQGQKKKIILNIFTLYATAVEPRVHINNKHTNFQFENLWIINGKQLTLVVNFLFG
jgi:hypothetical protein